MSRFIIVDVNPFVSRSALVEDGVLLDYAVDRQEEKINLYDVFLGKVERRVPSLNGAFVNVGNEAVFLTNPSEQATEGTMTVVQVIQEPFDGKEAKVTEDLRFTDYFLEYYPKRANSVKAEKAVGKRGAIQSLSYEGAWILKDRAEGATDEELQNEARYVKSFYDFILSCREKDNSPRRLFSFGNKWQRYLFNVPTSTLVTNDEKLGAYFKKIDPKLEVKISSLEEFYYLDEQLKRSLEKKVPLLSGGNIVVEKTEACSIIDVNSGNSAVGDKGFNSLKVNMEAAKEIAAQLSLRNLAGSILVDFITLKGAENKKKVISALRENVEKDSSSVTVYDGFTRLGFVEISRKRERTLTPIEDLLPIWKLRKNLAALTITKARAVRITRPAGREIKEEWFDFPFDIEWEEKETNDFVVQIL